MVPFAYLMIVVYPLGIPAMYAYLLHYKHAKELRFLKQLELAQDSARRREESHQNLNKAKAALQAARTVAAAKSERRQASRQLGAPCDEEPKLGADLEQLKEIEDRELSALVAAGLELTQPQRLPTLPASHRHEFDSHCVA